jgi:hypothetical protein
MGRLNAVKLKILGGASVGEVDIFPFLKRERAGGGEYKDAENTTGSGTSHAPRTIAMVVQLAA